jgi:hypothetical protein
VGLNSGEGMCRTLSNGSLLHKSRTIKKVYDIEMKTPDASTAQKSNPALMLKLKPDPCRFRRSSLKALAKKKLHLEMFRMW